MKREDKRNTYTNPYNLNDYRKRKDEVKESTRKKDESARSESNTSKKTTVRKERKSSAQKHKPDTQKRSTYQSQQEQKEVRERRSQLKQNNKLSDKKRIQLNKKKKIQAIQRMTAVIFIGIFLSYAVIKVIDLNTYPTVSYQSVREGMINNTKMLEGIIIRDEEIVYTLQQGDMHYVVGEGEKVAQNGDVCFIADDEIVQASLNQMVVLEESIYNVQDKRTDMSYFQAEIHQLNVEVMDEMDEFYYSRYWENTDSIYSIRKELEKVIQERTNIYINDETEFTEGLQGQRLELQEQLRNAYTVFKAQESGIVSYQIDLLEEYLTKEVRSNLTYEQFKEIQDKGVDKVVQIINEEIKQQESNSLEEEKVTEASQIGQELLDKVPLYKIIKDDAWEVVTYIETKDSNIYEVGRVYELYFDEYTSKEPVPFTLIHTVQEGEQTKLIFESNEKLAEFLSHRIVEFSIGENKATGLKIPLKAIIEKNVIKIPSEYVVVENDLMGVYKIQGDQLLFCPVDIQYRVEEEGAEYVYILQELDGIGNVKLGDLIKELEMEETYELSEVKIVQGVYAINGSYAQFKPIEIALTNEEYAILTEGHTTKLKEFDQIISNPQNIREDQLLKDMNIVN